MDSGNLREYKQLENDRLKLQAELELEKKRFAELIKEHGQSALSMESLIKKPKRLKIMLNKLKQFWNKLIWSL